MDGAALVGVLVVAARGPFAAGDGARVSVGDGSASDPAIGPVSAGGSGRAEWGAHGAAGGGCDQPAGGRRCDDPLFPLWWLVALRGLRRGEVVALRDEDFDDHLRELRVRRQLLLVDGRVHVGPPKSAAGVRVLALDDAFPG